MEIWGNVAFMFGHKFLMLMEWLDENVQQAVGQQIWHRGEIRGKEIDWGVTYVMNN